MAPKGVTAAGLANRWELEEDEERTAATHRAE